MRFHDRDNDVRSLLFEQVGVLQHLISLADTGSRADVNAQLRLLALVELGEKRFG